MVGTRHGLALFLKGRNYTLNKWFTVQTCRINYLDFSVWLFTCNSRHVYCRVAVNPAPLRVTCSGGKLKTSLFHPSVKQTTMCFQISGDVSYLFQRESIKYMNSRRISWLWILIIISLWISHHLALITHDATMSVNSSIKRHLVSVCKSGPVHSGSKNSLQSNFAQ